MKKFVVVLCLLGLIAGLVACQTHNQKQLYQAMGGWQSKVDMAHLNSKSPAQVSAFLTQHDIVQEPYTGIQLVPYKDTTSREGYILARTRSVAYIFGIPESHSWSVEMSFTFDDQDKCRSSYVWAAAS